MVTFSSYPDDERPRRVIDAFRDEGMFVDLICLGNSNYDKAETADNLKITRIPMKHRRGGKFTYAFQYGSFILVATLLFALRAIHRRYHLVYVHNMPDILVISALMPKALGAKVILDLHDPMPELMTTIFKLEKDSFNVRLIRGMEKWSIARANQVITVNQACKDLFSGRSCQAEKITVVMNTPDTKIFPFRKAVRHAGVEFAGRKPFIFMYHGTVVERNGLDVAIAALELAHTKMPDAQLRIFGPSTPFLEHVMAMVRAKGLQESVQYLGPKRLEDLVPAIEAADIGVIPNPRNSFTDINTPTRIFDYLSLGKTAIVPNTQGIKDYFPSDSLMYFEAGDAADLARKMEYAYSHRDELGPAACRGQEIYLAHTWQQERQTLLTSVNQIFN
jgi:glycosyltransferase involved in cell wall biosynthesis